MSVSRRRPKSAAPAAAKDSTQNSTQDSAHADDPPSWFIPVQDAPPPSASAQTSAPTSTPTSAQKTSASGTSAPGADRGPRNGGSRRRSRRRRRMPTRRRVALQLFAGLVLTGALLGVQGYDALVRYEDREPPPAVRAVPVGQAATLEHGDWRLVEMGPMPNPPSENRPERVWLQMTLEVTPRNEDGTKYTFLPPGLDLDDGNGHTWRVEVLNAPKQLRQGEPGRFTLVAVAPKDLADQVELVLWASRKSGVGPALRFDR